MTKVRLPGGDASSADGDAARQVLVYVLEGCLRLLHPYMPFVTEAIWQYLPHRGEALIIGRWPQADERDAEAEEAVSVFMELVRSIRNARTEYGVEPSRRIAATIVSRTSLSLLQSQGDALQFLARIDPARLSIVEHLETEPDKVLTLVVGEYTCYLPLASLVDLDKERARLQAEIDELAGEIARVDKLLANQGFVNKAPGAVVQKERDKRADYAERRARLQERLSSLT